MYDSNEKYTLVRQFQLYGSKNIHDLVPLRTLPAPNMALLGRCELYDQEPIEFDTIDLTPNDSIGPVYRKNIHIFNQLPLHDIIIRYSSAIRTPIICNSVKNSADIKILNDNNCSTVHYWYHGFIARDWYRQWEYYKKITHNIGKFRFGLYCRDASGSRVYRLQVLSELSKIHSNVFYNISPNISNQLQKQKLSHVLNKWPTQNDVSSDASAKIDWKDTQEFDIQIVLETLFEKSYVYLSEKILKAIVMFQPFIIFGPPNSLKYVKDYGFKTFESIWNEDYDSELNHTKRFNAIISLINSINKLNTSDYKILKEKAMNIALFNRTHFYSNQFKKLLISELHTEFDNALHEREIYFHTFPGGHLFYYLDKLQKLKLTPIGLDKSYLNAVLQLLNISNPETVKQIIKKYPNLL